MNSFEDTAVLVVKQTVTDLLATYCRAMDRCDEELALSVWHEGATVDYGEIFQGTGAGFSHWVMTAHTYLAAHTHHLSNVLTVVAPDRLSASSESCLAGTFLLPADASGSSVLLTRHGRYLDTWELREGRWGITARRYVEDLSFQQTLLPDQVLPSSPGSRRDRTDASYT